jgi:hypothetical protein
MGTAVGTIIAFGGDANNATVQDHLKEAGWLPCFGQTFDTSGDYAELYNVIGYAYGGGGNMFDLPDLQGLFLRAANAGQKETGQVQAKSTTSLPINSFTVTKPGNHHHHLPNLPTWSPKSDHCKGHYEAKWNDGDGNTSDDGEHTHSISGGGDDETRCVNVYVDFIIKYKSEG